MLPVAIDSTLSIVSEIHLTICKGKWGDDLESWSEALGYIQDQKVSILRQEHHANHSMKTFAERIKTLVTFHVIRIFNRVISLDTACCGRDLSYHMNSEE